MASIALRGGARMPAIGLGCWKIPKDVCAGAVLSAIKVGYRHLDGACDYGNEVEVGAGIASAIKEGLVTRADLWVTSKIWMTYHDPAHVEVRPNVCSARFAGGVRTTEGERAHVQA
jgi:D-xylose reductase